MQTIDLHVELTVVGALANVRKHCATGKSPYAKAYLDKLPLAEAMYDEHGYDVQLLYLLNNLSGWRGKEAKASKEAIKKHLRAGGHKI